MSRTWSLLLVLACVVTSQHAVSQTAPAAATAPGTASGPATAPAPAPALVPAPALAPVSSVRPSPQAQASAEAVVRVANRPVATFRAPFLGLDPDTRARRTERVIDQMVARGGPGRVSVQPAPQGQLVMIDGVLALVLVPEDVDASTGQTLDAVAQASAQALGRALAETAETRDGKRMLAAIVAATTATLLFGVALWAVLAMRRRVVAWVDRLYKARTDVAASDVRTVLLRSVRVPALARWLVGAVSVLVSGLLTYEWLAYVLSRFPYTRVWGEQLGAFLLDVLYQIGGGTLRALPDLFVAGLILLIARAVTRAFGEFSRHVEQQATSVHWLNPELAGPTRRLVTIGVWLLAFVMAYPYLPGSDSEAFKGVSVLVGLMLTLGASSIVGQAASGLILMYSRTLRVGEYVRIGNDEGTVCDVGTFTTRVRTGHGEELTLPNAWVLGTVTRNYSRTVQGKGYIVDTEVTIGYDTPWRQVEAMLVEAAARTPGILADPAPRVFLSRLSDFYVEYKLVAQAVPTEPRPRAMVLHELHANTLDVFNHYGVQIMSPHYVGDPAGEKVVGRADWFVAPARSPG